MPSLRGGRSGRVADQHSRSRRPIEPPPPLRVPVPGSRWCCRRAPGLAGGRAANRPIAAASARRAFIKSRDLDEHSDEFRAAYQAYQLEAAYLTLTSNVVGTAVQGASLRGQIAATEEIIKRAGCNCGANARRPIAATVGHGLQPLRARA